MEENKRFQKIIKRSVYFFILILIFAIVGTIILKYHVEGEQNMPFKLSQILVVSSAEGIQGEESKYNWDVDLYQTNDICLNIKKNKNYKTTEAIKSIEIANISIERPKIGNIKIYIPNSEKQTYEYKKEYEIDENIKYDGDKKTNLENLKISNQGGTILFRVVNDTGKEYKSNEEELKHDGILLDKVGLTNDDIKFKISFDIIIKLESDISFEGRIELELPVGDIANQGTANLDKKDMKDIIFKRK